MVATLLMGFPSSPRKWFSGKWPRSASAQTEALSRNRTAGLGGLRQDPGRFRGAQGFTPRPLGAASPLAGRSRGPFCAGLASSREGGALDRVC